jgi:hypothetical protein
MDLVGPVRGGHAHPAHSTSHPARMCKGCPVRDPPPLVIAIALGVFATTRWVIAIALGVFAIALGVFAIALGVFAIALGVFATTQQVLAKTSASRALPAGRCAHPAHTHVSPRDGPPG